MRHVKDRYTLYISCCICTTWIKRCTWPFILCVLCCFLAAAVVGQQGVWGAHRHRATVPQSLVHSPSLPQLWPLLRGLTGHDKGKGSWPVVSRSLCIHAFKTMESLLSSALFCVCLFPGVLWHLACVDGRPATVLWSCNSRWQGTFVSSHLSYIVINALTYIWRRPFSDFCIWFFLQEVIFYKVIDYILHGKEDIKVIPWVPMLSRFDGLIDNNIPTPLFKLLNFQD